MCRPPGSGDGATEACRVLWDGAVIDGRAWASEFGGICYHLGPPALIDFVRNKCALPQTPQSGPNMAQKPA